MKLPIRLIAFLILFLQLSFSIKEISIDNTLSSKEKKEGWKLLFDGKSMRGWRIYQNKNCDSWVAEDGTLHCKNNKISPQRGNLITTKEYENFDLTIDWKLSPQGNSGILYMVNEKYKEPYLSGPEYQLLDDKGYPDKIENWQQTGANYAMDPPTSIPTHDIGEWNHSRIIVNKNHVEHWLNGVKVVEYELYSDEWKKHKNEGKWKDAPGYGIDKKGHICLQDHGSEIWFKNIKIKEL